MSRAPRILVVSPEPGFQARVQRTLDADGLLAAAAADLDGARRFVSREKPAAIVVDVRATPQLQFALEANADDTPLIALVGPDSRRAAELLASGVADVISTELMDAVLVHRLRSLLPRGERRGAGDDDAGLLMRAGRRQSDRLIGRSPAMLKLAEQINMVAKSDIGAAIYGETGTGKELVARAIHTRSRRAGRPYIVANCTALPEALFENELFGHERGAFTGADTTRTGLIREAAGGTLMLDEIGEIGASVQAKLLRLMQFREFKMVGGQKTQTADIRILSTTHRNLEQAVEDGRFRQDLFYRMNTLHITVPPLRDRLDDIPLLVDHFVSLFNQREQREFVGFSVDAIGRLQGHPWPGNVRQLEGVVYRSLVMAGDRRLVGAEDVQLSGRSATPQVALDESFAEQKRRVMGEFERTYLDGLLRRAKGNLSLAARLAKHERKSLWRLIKKHGLDPQDYKSAGSGS